MAKGSPEHRQVYYIKYPLIAVVVLYLFWLLGLPLLTLIKDTLYLGWAEISRQLFQREVAHAFYLTFWLSLCAVVLNTIFGTITAWVMVRQKFFGRKIINGLVDLPFAVSPVVVGYMFILLLGKDSWLGSLLEIFHIQWIFSFPGMVLATLFVTFPFMIRELIPTLQEIGTEQEDAARILGAGGWTTFWKITLPSIKWGLLYGISLTLARALGEFGAVLVVGGGISGATETATIFVYRGMEERRYAGAFGASLILIGISFLLLLSMELFRKRTQE